MDNPTAIQLLTLLRTRANDLAAGESILAEAFQSWHRRALEVLAEMYGDASPELADFKAISYELQADSLDSFEATLRKAAERREVDLSKESIPLRSSQIRRYHQGLAEAAELLTTLILRRRPG